MSTQDSRPQRTPPRTILTRADGLCTGVSVLWTSQARGAVTPAPAQLPWGCPEHVAASMTLGGASTPLSDARCGLSDVQTTELPT